MSDRLPWWIGLAGTFGPGFARLLAATWRVRVLDSPEYTAALAGGERFVYAFWHSGILPLALHRRDEGIAVLISRHRDGELIARVIERLGYVTARGSSTRGGDQGVRELLEWAERGRHLAFTPDGPRGPAERVKDGVVFVAARTGRRIVPIGVGASSAWILRSWDRFRVPRPFARICVMHGAPIVLEAQLDRAINRVTSECRLAAGAAAS